MSTAIYIGYLHYVVLFFFATGGLILYFDVTGYGMQDMQKEKKVASFLGWVNVSFGALTFVTNWVYQQWLF
ncbi:CLC_0170 family protein [Ammoniphilus sp. 3BR4]|uniref:CLC_0170 family protein n=1 Tax=Ammoniphilus sp. 3BR4 TaxID=3158265 RepID=UPI003465267D